MIKVITYGTYDLLHYGHIRLLERAKALGDYLIVGVTADDFDITRGKINVQQTLIERIEAVRSTGLADEIVVEEYEGQKIDDIQRLHIDIFTVGSDWIGKFDYLNEFCKVVYLDRTQGISSSELRTREREIRLGLVGESVVLNKIVSESKFVNGVELIGIWTLDYDITQSIKDIPLYNSYDALADDSDALYIASHPSKHYEQIKVALLKGKNVLYESPLALNVQQCKELMDLAEKKRCVLYEGIKTAYSVAYSRMILLAKTGKIGEVVSVDATCTSLRTVDYKNKKKMDQAWNSLTMWGPTALLPVFQLLGVDYNKIQIISRIAPTIKNYDEFTKISFVYPHSVASIKVGMGAKSEGELVISGTKGYIYVPAPWWKLDYFELRYENPADNKRYFYQVDGEGIRYQIVSFLKSVNQQKIAFINGSISLSIVRVMQDFEERNNVITI